MALKAPKASLIFTDNSCICWDWVRIRSDTAKKLQILTTIGFVPHNAFEYDRRAGFCDSLVVTNHRVCKDIGRLDNVAWYLIGQFCFLTVARQVIEARLAFEQTVPIVVVCHCAVLGASIQI
jgi:hypothetical protein